MEEFSYPARKGYNIQFIELSRTRYLKLSVVK